MTLCLFLLQKKKKILLRSPTSLEVYPTYQPACLSSMDAGRRHKTLRSEEEGAIIPSTAGDMNFMFELAPLILQDPQGEAMMQSQVDAHMRRTGITAGNPELKNPNS